MFKRFSNVNRKLFKFYLPKILMITVCFLISNMSQRVMTVCFEKQDVGSQIGAKNTGRR
jgi:hypothetical protein